MNGKIVIRRKKKHFDLNDACEAGDMARVRTLVEEGLDLSEPWSHEEFTPVSIALYRNDVPMIAYLLEHGMPPYFNLQSIVQADPEGDPSDYSLLAPWQLHEHEALMFLLEHGSPANSLKTGYNALVSLVYMEESDCCAKSDEFFAALLSREPDVDQIMDDDCTLLHQIATGNNRYVPLLVARSKQVDAPSSPRLRSATPLRKAAQEGADVAVEALLQAGANPNLKDRYNDLSILDDALWGQKERRGWRRHERVIELLRAHGAKTRAEMRKCGRREKFSGKLLYRRELDMDFIINLSFVSDDPFWYRERMPQWWQRFSELGGGDWQRWLHENRFLAEPPLPEVDDLQMQGNEVKVVLHTGSDAVDTAPMLVAMLYKAGCTEVEALLFSDEAESVIDEEGKAHLMGLRYYINEDGKLAVADYPEVEYVDE